MNYWLLLKFFAIAITLFLIQSCASSAPLSLEVQELEGQTTLFNSGKTIVVSSKAVMVAATSTDDRLTDKGEYLAIRIIFVNSTDESISINPDVIEAHGMQGNQLVVLSSVQHELAVEQTHKSQRIGLALQAFGAATSTSTATHSGTVDGYSYSGTSTYPTNNVEKQKAVQNDITRMNADIQSEKTSYLKRHTLFPNEEYYGSIWVKKPASFETPYSLMLEIPVENETHHFKITIEKAGAL